MKTWLKISVGLLVWGAVLSGGCSGATTNQPATAAAAIQAIRQAPDPSAVISAYASGFAVAFNDPQLYQAYVTRMVDMGLPEMAYHQAQTLTALQPDSGLAWGVMAYVDARRGQMPEAVSAINLAGQFAPANQFVAHTAGEILAWYDLKADKSKLPDNAKEGVARIRVLLEKQPAFISSYDTARNAYQSQSNAAPSSAPAAGTASSAQAPSAAAASPTSPGAYAPQAEAGSPAVVPADQGAPATYLSPSIEPAYAPTYYPAYDGWAPDYYDDWGPGWVAPSPWCWWYPCGFWGGCGFYPYGLTFAFGFGHGDHDHGHGFDHHNEYGCYGRSGLGGGFGGRPDPAFWHNGAHGTHGFFGTPAQPTATLAQLNHQGSASSSFAAAGGAARWWDGASRSGAAIPRTPLPSGGSAFVANNARATQGTLQASRAPASAAPTIHSWSGTARSYPAAPSPRPADSPPAYRAPVYSAPHYAAPASRWSGAYHSVPSYGGLWGRSAPAYSAPATHSFSGGFHSFGGGAGGGFSGGHSFDGGGSHGGGFHGGGFGGGGSHSGGGFGGGGHR